MKVCELTATPEQIGLLHHTLGVTPERRQPYRNHFVAGDGHYAMPDLAALEAAGMMVRRPAPAFCDPGDIVFYVTEAGRYFALDALPPPEPPRKKSNYQKFLDDDYGHSFAEWLGIEVPRRERKNYVWSSDPQYGWVRLRTSRDTGEYCKTLKEAKASYKAALKARKQREAAH